MQKLQTAFASTCLALLLSLIAASPAPAADATAAAPASGTEYTPGKKLERGLHNGFTGWMEAPVTVDKFHKERNLFEALTTGVTRGVGLAIARTGVGIYEAVTSPFPAPEKYEPLMMPERV